jgi:hypothetical protein
LSRSVLDRKFRIKTADGRSQSRPVRQPDVAMAPQSHPRLAEATEHSGGGEWFPHKVVAQLPDPIYFDAIWVVGLQNVAGEYTYAATRVDLAGVPKWRVCIASDFGDWTVEPIRAS